MKYCSPSIFIIIQARMTSSRLPKKVILPLCGKTVLEVIFDRLKPWKDNIIIATTNDGTEKPIIEICKKHTIKYYKGDTDNVLSRYYRSAVQYGAKATDIIVRVTSDSPLIDSGILFDTVKYYTDGDFDYVSNRVNRKVPVGLDVEVFNFEVLEYAFLNATESFEKEHVTPFMYMNQPKYRVGSYEPELDGSMFRLTLDEADDYLAIKEIYDLFKGKTDFNYETLISMMKSNPRLYRINLHVQQKQL